MTPVDELRVAAQRLRAGDGMPAVDPGDIATILTCAAEFGRFDPDREITDEDAAALRIARSVLRVTTPKVSTALDESAGAVSAAERRLLARIPRQDRR